MQVEFNIALIQTSLDWENPIGNKKNFENYFKQVASNCDLVVLPEMFTTGFTMNASKFAEDNEGPTLFWMQEMARQYRFALTGSIIIKDNENFYNRLVFVLPDGKYYTYDKRHTFTFAGENKIYASGKERLIIDFKGWRICPLICYDLRFPVWSRNNQDYDLLMYVANWPEKRIEAWDTLLKARAIENMSYCAGLNRVGTDENGINYPGHSLVYDALGKVCSEAVTAEIITATLNKTDLEEKRRNFRFLDDKDDFILK